MGPSLPFPSLPSLRRPSIDHTSRSSLPRTPEINSEDALTRPARPPVTPCPSATRRKPDCERVMTPPSSDLSSSTFPLSLLLLLHSLPFHSFLLLNFVVIVFASLSLSLSIKHA